MREAGIPSDRLRARPTSDRPWDGYEKYLAAVGRHVRVTYNHGRLELRTTSFEHERAKRLLGALLDCLLEECGLDYEPGGETTFQREDLERGLEPDECYWIRNWQAMAGKKHWHHPADPPPDLVLEVDVTSSSMDRIEIYRTMGVAEVWHLQADGVLQILALGAGGVYERRSDASPTFPMVSRHDIQRHVDLGQTETVSRTRTVFRRFLRGLLSTPPPTQDR